MPFHSCASWEPEANIACGVSILENYIARSNGNVREGLAAYNAGMTGRDVYGRGYSYADAVLSLLTKAE